MLRDQLKNDLKSAMREKDMTRVGTLRLVLAAIKDRDISARGAAAGDEDDDGAITDILTKMVKQRQESIRAYDEGGRCELAERERAEIAVIETFLPKQLNEAEIEQACRRVVTELGADSLKDIGRCMGALKERHAGQMDFSKASAQVKAILA